MAVDLAFGQRQPGLPLDPGQRFPGIDIGPGQRSAGDATQPLRDHLLRPIQSAEKNARHVANRVRDHRALGEFEIQRGRKQLLADLQQFDREVNQFLRRQATVAVVHRLDERVGDPGAKPDHRRLLDPEPHGDRVGGPEADTANIAREPVWVLGHHLDGIGAVGPEDANRPRGADAMAVQEDHDLPHDLLFRPGRGDAPGADRANAVNLTQPIRLGLDDVEHLLAEHPDHLLRVDRADAADHAGGEVFLDAIDRRRRRGADETGLELLTVGAVVDPFTRRGDPFPGGDRGGVTHDGDQITVTARLRAQDAEAVFGVVERHPFDDAGDDLAVRLGGRWWRGHGPQHYPRVQGVASRAMRHRSWDDP